MSDDEDDLPPISDAPPINLRKPTRRDVVARPEGAPGHLSIVEMRIAQFRLDVSSVGDYVSQVTGLVVGENPGPNTHEDLPLFPWPKTSSAGRLMAMGGLTPGEYLGGLYRRNLCDTKKWREGPARVRARELITALFDMPRDLRVVLCGLKVAEAFGFSRHHRYWDPVKLESRQVAVVIPHPSGLNHIYNKADARQLTGQWIRWAALGEQEPTV